MAKQEPKKGIPEKIKLGEVEYTVKDHPELLTLIQNARSEEKDKLYTQINSLEAQKRVLEDEKKSAGELTSKQETDLQNLKDKLAVKTAEFEKVGKQDPKGDPSGDEPKKKTETDKGSILSEQKVEEMLKKALAKQSEEHKRELDTVRGGLNQKNVSDYRKEQLAKNDGLIIADLVPENLDSEEAVNKAIASALEKSKPYIYKEYDVDGKKQKMSLLEFEEFESSNKSKGKRDDGTEDYTPPRAPQRPEGGDPDVSSKELLSNVSNMTDEEYEKHRESIMKEVKAVKYEDTPD